MGIFNEHSSNQHPFARGIQGAPGVGFNLTSNGDYDMVNKKLRNVGAPTSNTDAATKKYVDDNSGGKTSVLTIDSNTDMKDTYRILNLKAPSDEDEPVTKKYAESNFFYRDGSQPMTGDIDMNNKKIKNLPIPTVNGDAATKKYVDDSKVDGSVFLKIDGTRSMTGNLNMNNNQIYNIPNPNGPKQPTPLAYTDLAYLHVDGSNKMTNHLNMNNKKITHLQAPTSNSDAATKLYVDNKSTNPQDLSPYLKKNGSVPMAGSLNMSGYKIINLEDPASDNDAVNKKYMNDHLHTARVQPSHYKDEFSYLMSSTSEWTDEITTGTSFNMKKIADLPPSKGNFHDYNHKVIYMEIVKNSQGGYKYKMRINFYRLPKNVDYTLCLEILNTDYELWHKSQISVVKGTSRGLAIENVGVKNLSHRFTNSKGQTEFMYYHRIIVNFKKLLTGSTFFLHIVVNIPQDGSDLAIYPKNFTGVFIIAYGVVSKVSNINPDKVYDYHTAFDIQKTQVVYNVDINANNKKILNINLDKNQNNSVATVGMVKELFPFTTNYVYRRYFEKIYDFTDANNYGLSRGSSGIIINALNHYNHNLGLHGIGIPNRNISDIKKEGLNITNYTISFSPPPHFTNYTLCIVFYHWSNRDFALVMKNSQNDQGLLSLTFTKAAGYLTLLSNNKRNFFSFPSSFDGKKIVLWLAESVDSIVTKVNISNYSSTLTLANSNYTTDQYFEFITEDGVISKILFSPNFYDFDSEQFHRVMLQEKLNGSYVL